MPFLTPIMASPIGGALLKGGIGLGASLIGSKLAGGQSKQATAAEDSITKSMQQGRDMATSLQGQASPLISLAGKSFNPVVDYWSQILSGNRGAATAMLAPELNQIGDTYQAQRESQSALNPRGGGRATILGNLPYQQARDASTLMQTARPAAAQGLLAAGQGAAGAGTNILSNAVAALNGSTLAGRSILENQQALRESQLKTGNAIGRSVFDLLKGLNFKTGAGGGIGSSSGANDISYGAGQA